MHGCEELFKKQSKAGFAADKRNITQIVNWTPHHCNAEKMLHVILDKNLPVLIIDPL